MADVRAGVDALDRQLVELLAVRFGFMRAAARIKAERSMVRDEARKTQVIAAARQVAAEATLRYIQPHVLHNFTVIYSDTGNPVQCLAIATV